VSFGGSEVFHHTNCVAIAKAIRERREEKFLENTERGDSSADGYTASMALSTLMTQKFRLPGNRFDQTRMDNSSGFFATLFQLVPLLVIYPVWQLTRFFLFFRCLVYVLQKVPSVHSLVLFVATLVTYHFIWVTLTPLLFVAVKWTVIGRYQCGRYPIWGQYYLRWWFVDVVRKLIGRGIFGSSETLLNLYYRMCGATIGHDARISLEADLAEYDLVTIGNGAAIEYATVRAFGVDNGCMMLGPVSVGDYASIGVKSVVCPFTSIPDFHHLGPVTSSYEVSASFIEPGHDVKHAKYNRQALPEPNFISQAFICRPIMLFVETMSHLPALYVFYWMVSMPWRQGKSFDSINDLMSWLCEPRRIPFYIGIRIARAIAAPVVYMLFAVLVKRLIIGKFRAGPRDASSQWELSRHKLVQDLFTREAMQNITELVGRHYELVSCIYRALGAKIGKRVFWPGHQPIFSGEFDLLEVGDDVVFGSRSTIICSTVNTAEKVIFCAGANISDNTVVLPGAIVGKNAVLGSNTLCPAGRYLPESSISFGAKSGEPVMLDRGMEDFDGPVLAVDIKSDALPMDGDESTIRPFGRAFYLGEAGYFVFPLPVIIMFTMITKVLIAALDTMPMLGALHLSAAYWYGWPVMNRVYQLDNVTFTEVYIVMLAAFFLTHCARILIWLLVEVAAKWGFMGRRAEGRYNYHQDPYGQNWEFYQIISKIRDLGKINFLDFLAGTPFMAIFFRLLGCDLGNDCCLYPSGADPFFPEPDMVKMGDRCVIDCSSVVCHLNTRGNFELVPITLGNNVTLRTGSRVQQGVNIESGAMLLEKSLAMTGEVIEEDTVWQGAPARQIYSYDTSSIASRATTHTDSGSFHMV
jgi:acetyltransferase-like isoleucine patch superfamily enzyme